MEIALREWIAQGRHVVLLAMLVCALYTDLAWGRIYNWLVYPALGFGLAAAYLLGDVGWAGGVSFAPTDVAPSLVKSAAGAVLGGGLFFVLYLSGGMGGGDVKLMAAIGSLLGVGFCLTALFYTSLVGAALALGVLIWKGRLLDGLRGTGRIFLPWRDRTRDPAPVTIPYGVAIAFGTMWAWWTVFAR